MSRIGAIAAAPFLGGQFVSLYRGATRVPTVPGKPVITSANWLGAEDVESVAINLSAPNDGGSAISEYYVFINGEYYDQNASTEPGQNGFALVLIEGTPELVGEQLSIAALNEVGLGSRSNSVPVGEV